MTRFEVRKVMSVWPTVMRLATDDWAKEFAQSVWRQSGEPNWEPTLKQARIMRRMARELAAFVATKQIIADASK